MPALPRQLDKDGIGLLKGDSTESRTTDVHWLRRGTEAAALPKHGAVDQPAAWRTTE
jgi:hypothetical protein